MIVTTAIKLMMALVGLYLLYLFTRPSKSIEEIDQELYEVSEREALAEQLTLITHTWQACLTTHEEEE